MADIELGQDVVDVGQNIYENNGIFSDKNQKKALVADMSASVISSGGDLVQAVEEVSNKSAEEMKLNASDNYAEKQGQLIEDSVNYVAATNPEQLPKAVDGARKAFKDLDEKRASKIAPYLNWVDTLEGSESLSQEEKESIAIDTAFLQAISEGVDERAWYETGWDLLGLMAVPDESYNVAAVEQQLMGDTVGLTEWFSSEDSLNNIAKFRSELSSSERAKFDERLVDIIKGVDDNQLQQVMLALNLLGRDPDSRNFQALEKLDVALVATSLGKGLVNGIRSLNVLNRTAQVGDARAVNKIAKAVASDEAIAREAGVTQIDAATVGNPVFKGEGVFNGAPEGLQKKYRDYDTNVREALDRANNVLGYTINIDSKDADEIVAAMNKNFAKNDDIDNIKVSRTKAGVMFEYDILDGDSNITKRETKLFKLDDLGGFEQKEAGFVGSLLRGVTSPNTLTGADRELFVQAAEAALYSKGRTAKGLTDAVDESLKPIGGNVNKLKRVSDMLVLMDGKDLTPSYQTLVIDGVGGKRLTEDEFLAFTGVRKVLDDTYYLNNDVLRREMELKGLKMVDVDETTSIFSKPAGDADTAYSMFSGDVENTYIRHGDEVLQGIGLDEFKQFYKEGKVLVRSDSSAPQEWFTSSVGQVKFSLVNKSDIKELPTLVLNKENNYLPKTRKDANWFVKKNEDIVVNNVTRNIQKTVAYSATESQAKGYVSRLIKAAQDAGEEINPEDFKILFDREISKGTVNSDTITLGGGLIRGKRKSTDIEWAGGLEEGGRTDALDAIQRYMSITADRAALSEWRLEARTRLINEIASHPEIGSKAKELSWQALRAEISDSGIELQQRAKLLAAYDQISEMSNIPSVTDQRFQGLVKAVGLKFDRMGKENVAKYLYQMHDKSIVDVMKGATFNLTLGLFNWVQIPVQLFGASVAASINPVAAGKGASRWLMSSTLDFVTNEKTAEKFLKKISKDLGDNEQALANDYRFWRKSGMYESVVRGSADAASISNRLPYDAGMLRKGFDKAVSAGQTPYRMGELSNMRISFFTALEEMKDLKGKSFKYDDPTLQKVIARAEQFRLNMSGANKAAFQKGIWALPTQFKQIYGKYIEAVMGTHFTKKEKGKLLLGQALLFGAAGVPIMNHFQDQFFDLVGLDAANLTADELVAVKRGAIGWMLNEEYDIDALVSGRLTVSADVLEDLRRALLDTNTPALKTVLGASFTGGDKVWDLWNNFLFAGNLIIDDYMEVEDLSPAMKGAAEILARSAANVPASTRKWLAAWDLTEGMVRKSDGSLLMQVDPDIGDVYARAIGFGSQELDDLYVLRQAESKRKDKIKTLAGRYISMLYDMQSAITNQDENSVEQHQIAAAMVKRHIYSLGGDDAQQVMDLVVNRIANPRDFKEETLNTAIMNSLSEFTSSANKLSVIKQKYIEENNLGQ